MENFSNRGREALDADVKLPKRWVFCFNNECRMAENCMRRFSASIAGNGQSVGMALIGNCADGEACKWYVEKRIVSMAWGLNKAFDNVLHKDSAAIHGELLKILGNKGGYYRYNNGRKWLSPEKQEMVRAVFSRHGYDGIEFDHHINCYSLS